MAQEADKDTLRRIEDKIGLHSDFPKKGILFR